MDFDIVLFEKKQQIWKENEMIKYARININVAHACRSRFIFGFWCPKRKYIFFIFFCGWCKFNMDVLCCVENNLVIGDIIFESHHRTIYFCVYEMSFIST